jgi:methyltransferase (TIGR00027 family)
MSLLYGITLPQKGLKFKTCNISSQGVLGIRGDDMREKSMTAIVSAFARAHHSENNDVKIFDDILAKLLLGNDYQQVAGHMLAGIEFFNPTFQGDKDEALRWIVDNYLAPSPLGRAAFTERALESAVRLGTTQYLIFAAGYDSFAYRRPAWANELSVFEIDHPATAEDKQIRLKKAEITIPNRTYYLTADFLQTDWSKCFRESPNYSPACISFCSLLGISYYLPADRFRELLMNISQIIPKGSKIAFDYPDEKSYTEQAGERAEKQAMLASSANETMLASYSYSDMENLLDACGFSIAEHLTPDQITSGFFSAYNEANPMHAMSAFDSVNYCLAVKKH